MFHHKNYREDEWTDGEHVWDLRESEFIDEGNLEDLICITQFKAQEIAFRQESYDEYLCTDYWLNTRKLVLMRANNKCEACGRTSKYLDVHHKKYCKRGTEQLNLHLLEALCRACHSQSH